ncbi:exodeoxyribonuclease V subunit gamma [Leptospira sp. WS92.C1]
MPITHITSLSLEDIALELSKNIFEEQRRSPLRSPVVVVPSTNMKLWLNLNLSKINGLSANIRFLFLEKTFEEYYHARAGLDYDPFRRPFPSHEANQRKILNYLLENRNNPEIRFLNSFLQSIPRAFSLSAKLTSLFKDYELNRSSWIQSWGKEKGLKIPMISRRSSPFPKEDDYYQFEKELYQNVFLNSKEPSTLTQFLLIESQKKIQQTSKSFPSIHLFCLSNLADTYLGILESISENDQLPIYLYQFHTGLNTKYDRANEPGPERWSSPQIHIAERMASIPGCVFKNKESSGSYPKRLNILRNLLKGDTLDDTELKSVSDSSVRFWNAPSAYRETEAVGNDILHKMSRDSKLTYLDFAILVTDMKTYRPCVEWVFDGGVLLQTEKEADSYGSKNPVPIRKKIPYSLTDIKANEASLLYRALMNFWEICTDSSIQKESLLHLLHNPLLQKKMRIDSEKTSALEDLIHSSGIRYEESGRENDLFQISNGMRRVRLSSILSKENAWTQYKTVPIEIESDETSSKLTIFWETILKSKKDVLSFLNGKKYGWSLEYFKVLKFSLEELFEFTSEYEQEKQLFQSWFDSLSDWEGIEFQNEKEGLELLKFITQQIFDQIPYQKGAYLIGGVTISLLQPMRPIPFKHIYILGLGEGKFPGSPDRSQLNLRKDVKEEWDISRKEIQESLLWETIHSAKESLTLSYVGENLQEDKTFEPCSHLFEIMESFGVREAIQLPLHSYSTKYDHSPEKLEQGLVSYDFARVWVNGNPNDHNILNRFQDPKTLEKDSKSVQPSVIPIRDLSQFLSDPLDTYLKKKLGMYLDEEEILDAEGEPFDLDAIAEAAILKKIHNRMIPSLVSQEAWEWNEEKISKVLLPILELEKHSARFPQSVFGKLQQTNLLNYLNTTSRLLANWKPLFQGGTYYSYLSLGDTGLPDNVCKKLPELKISLDGEKTFRIRGEWEHVIEKDGNFYWLFSKSLEEKPEDDNYGYKDYWKTMSLPFLSGIAFASINENFKIYSFKSRPSEDSKKKNSLPFYYELERSQAGLTYFQKVLSSYLQDEPVFFPRKAFLNYYVKNIQGDTGKTATPDDTAKFEDEIGWENYLREELGSVKESLSSLVKLYPTTQNLILKSQISWAKDFYKPFLDWKRNL